MSICYIGSTPAEEECAQTGVMHYDWARYQKLECRAYILALKRFYGDPPEGSRLFISPMPHDFGTYHEVQLNYDSKNQEHVDYALKVENGMRFWSEAGMWAPVLYHPEDGHPFGVLEDHKLWIRSEDELLYDVRPRGRDRI